MRTFLIALGFWTAAFTAIGLAFWVYMTVTELLGMNLTTQMVGLLSLVCVVAALGTARGWDQP